MVASALRLIARVVKEVARVEKVRTKGARKEVSLGLPPGNS